MPGGSFDHDPPERAASGRGPEPVRGRDHRRWAFVDGMDDLSVIDSAQVHRRDRKVSVTERALDDQQRHSLSRHLNGVSVPQLVWCEAAPYTRAGRGCA